MSGESDYGKLLIYLYSVLPMKYDLEQSLIVEWLDENVPVFDLNKLDKITEACETWCKSIDDKRYKSEANDG